MRKLQKHFWPTFIKIDCKCLNPQTFCIKSVPFLRQFYTFFVSNLHLFWVLSFGIILQFWEKGFLEPQISPQIWGKMVNLLIPCKIGLNCTTLSWLANFILRNHLIRSLWFRSPDKKDWTLGPHVPWDCGVMVSW